MKSKPVVLSGAFVLFLFLIAALSLKDRIALYQINKSLTNAMPGSVFYAERFSLWPGSLTIKNFGIKKKIKTRISGLTFQGAKATFRFSLFSLLRGDLSGLHEADIFLNQLSYNELRLENLKVDFPKTVGISRIKHQKIEAKNLSGRLAVVPDALLFDDIVVSLFGGRLRGAGKLTWTGARPLLDIKIYLQHIEIRDVTRALEMEKRMEANGVYDGEIHLVLEDFKIKDLNGRLDSAGGGQFTLTDQSLKDQNILDNKGLNIVVENLKDYHYDIGNAKIRKDGPDIKAEILLEGEAGNRRLEVVWHGTVEQP